MSDQDTQEFGGRVSSREGVQAAQAAANLARTSEQEIRQSLLPRFTLSRFLAGFTICILFAWFIRQAIAGQIWAIAFVIAGSSLLGFFGIYAIIFLLIWLPARFARGREVDLREGRSFTKDQVTQAPIDAQPAGR